MSETHSPLKPQDVLVACRLCVGGVATQSELAEKLRMSSSTVWKSRRRLRQLRFFESAAEDSKIDPYKIFGLFVYGVPMFFPVQRIGVVRGMPTSVHSPLFKERFAGSSLATVWPYGRGKEVGDGLLPIYPSVPSACSLDPVLYEVMAAAEILRVGKQREREAAEKYLWEKLGLEDKGYARKFIPSDKETT